MKIAIDAREIDGGAGKARYVRELVLSLSEIDQKNKYFLYVWERPKLALSSNFEFIKLPKNKIRLLWLRRDLKARKVDVFLSPTGYHPVIFSKVKSVLVVHDLAVFVEKHTRAQFKTMLIERLSLPLALRRANYVIADSENTRQDLIKCFKTKTDKVKTVLLAPFKLRGKPESEKEVRNKYHLPDRYILFVGTLEPRKNIDGLIRAYANLPVKLKKKYPLVLAGRRGWHTEEIDLAIKQTDSRKSILETGYFAEGDLPALYGMASVFVYPSWYEGFGLPPLEAMGYGVPVICSNTSSLPEVAGDAALKVNPANQRDISSALEKLLTNESLRAKLIEAGENQAKQFSWEKTAKQTLEILEKVGKND